MSDAFDHHLGEDLAAMADGGRALSPARKLELEQHVGDCAVCKSAIAGARLVLETVDATKPPEPSPSFNAALFSRLDAVDRASAPSLWERIREMFTLPKFGLAVAACAAVVFAIVFFRPDSGSPEQLLTPELAMNIDGLAIAEDLDLYQDLEVAENFDVLDDLDAIDALDADGGGEPG